MDDSLSLVVDIVHVYASLVSLTVTTAGYVIIVLFEVPHLMSLHLRWRGLHKRPFIRSVLNLIQDIVGLLRLALIFTTSTKVLHGGLSIALFHVGSIVHFGYIASRDLGCDE